jgi:hypothetical protein
LSRTRTGRAARRVGLLVAAASALAALPGGAPLAAQDPSTPQGPHWDLALQDVPVDDALTRLVSLTGIDLVYASEVTRGRRTFCRATEASAEDLLRCIVRGAELDFYRLSSGTYVVIDDPRDAPAWGTVVGVILDADSGMPVPFAAVEEPRSGRRTVSDAQGRFLLPGLVPGDLELVASGMGYRAARAQLGVPAAGAIRRAIHLRPEAVRMAPLVVRGMEPRLSRDELGEAVTAGPTLQAGAIHRGPVTGVARRSGVSRSPFAADLRIQGGAVGEHLVRLDGVPVFEPVSLGRMLSAFSPLALERITVRKAGFGVEHGSFIGGVVEVEQGVGGDAGDGLAGRIDPYAAEARLTLPLPGVGGAPEGRLLTALRSSVWGLWQEPVLNGMLQEWNAVDPVLMRNLAPDGGGAFADALDWQPHRHGSDLFFQDVHVRAEVPMGSFRRLEASVYRGVNRVGTDLFAAGIHPETGLPDRLVLSRDAYDWGNTAGQVSWSALVGERGSLRLRLRGSRHRLDHSYGMVDGSVLDTPPAEVAAPGSLEGLLGAALDSIAPASDGNTVSEVAGEAVARWAPSRSHVVSGGVEVARVDSRVHLDDPWFQRLSSAHRQDRVSGWVQDRWTPTEAMSVEVGLRATRLADRGEGYLEPRAAVRFDLPEVAGGPLSARVSWGLHRQFLNRYEVTSVGPSALVPAVQFWAPTDPSVRPPRAEHVSAEAVWRPRPEIELRAEGWHKEFTHLLDLDYGALLHDAGGALREVEQAAFVGQSRGRASGLGVRLAYRTDRWRARVGYDRTVSRRTFPSRFGGALQPVPWLEPHRLTAAGEVGVGGGVTLRAEFMGIWERPWGLRRPYYDYLAVHGGGVGPQLSHPGDDTLPPLLETDLTVGWSTRVGDARVELRALVRNVFDRDNVLDRSLLLETGDAGGPAYRPLARLLPGVTPLIAVRILP